MTILKKAKNNLFILAVISAYIILFAVRADMGISSLQSSGYYIKEMISIMPVIFILTALLDIWVPKEKIMKFLGKEAKMKGAALSFILGSISAGPLYAAFPMCAMLSKKGASIRNIVIILSSWAVIKIPMLLNEMKFLGLEFMAVRWVLTVIAIIVFSWLTAKLVKNEDMPQEEEKRSGIEINQNACIGCSLCAKNYPELFELKNKKAKLIDSSDKIIKEKLQKAIDSCPTKAITFYEDNKL